MRIESTNLPPAAREHARVFNGTKPFPGLTKGQTTASTETASDPATSAASDKPEKLIPAGLLAAQAHFTARQPDEMTKGQSQAPTSINRNIARYQDVQSS